MFKGAVSCDPTNTCADWTLRIVAQGGNQVSDSANDLTVGFEEDTSGIKLILTTVHPMQRVTQENVLSAEGSEWVLEEIDNHYHPPEAIMAKWLGLVNGKDHEINTQCLTIHAANCSGDKYFTHRRTQFEHSHWRFDQNMESALVATELGRTQYSSQVAPSDDTPSGSAHRQVNGFPRLCVSQS